MSDGVYDKKMYANWLHLQMAFPVSCQQVGYMMISNYSIKFYDNHSKLSMQHSYVQVPQTFPHDVIMLF